MYRVAYVVVPVIFAFAPTTAFAQLHMSPRNQHDDPTVADTSRQADPRHAACDAGDKNACFAIEFGLCADGNPRVAINECSRQLAAQDNRITGGNIRFERAMRYMLRAYAHVRLGEMEEALADYDLAVATDGSVSWIHIQRGDAYFLTGQYREALASYDRALEIEPESTTALNNRAVIYAAAPDATLHNSARALADAERLNGIFPDQPAYVDTLGVAYAANGNFERAAAEAQRAIELLPPGNEAVAEIFRSRLELYENGMPFMLQETPES
jgi:tetratricopeptide (TPR) repeat protein